VPPYNPQHFQPLGKPKQLVENQSGLVLELRFEPPQKRPTDSANAPNANSNAFKRAARKPIVALLDPLAALNFPAISPTHHVVCRRLTALHQQHAAGGFLYPAAVQGRLRQAVG
jgi:hypothetical protein